MSTIQTENSIGRTYQQYQNVNFDTSNAIMDTDGNPDFCKKLCDMTANCVGFIMNSDNSHCWLKKNPNSSIPNPNYSFYQASLPPSTPLTLSSTPSSTPSTTPSTTPSSTPINLPIQQAFTSLATNSENLSIDNNKYLFRSMLIIVMILFLIFVTKK